MKKYLLGVLLTLCLLPAPALRAEKVSRERAREAARTFFQYDRVRSPRRAVLHEVALSPLTKSDDPALYVFEREGGGFVIISGDDRCKPVLGYSFTNAFADPAAMPEGLREWLDDFAGQVRLVRGENRQAAPAAQLAWAAVEMRTKAGSGGFAPSHTLETPVWGQGEPFNDLAPMVDGKKAVAGCVPLTMGMICRFFRYPAAGSGTLAGYVYMSDAGTTQDVPGHELGHAYDWDKIKLDYSEYTAEEAAAVAQLIYDCGVMAQAKYDVSTSTNTGNMIRQAIEHLGFDAGAVYENRGFYTDEVWTAKLKAELQERPVMYSARRDGDYGHTFLLDGYDENDYFRINWGWKGSSNGYFALSAFVANPERAYVHKHAACFGLKPDAGGTGTPYLYLTSGIASSSGTEYSGLTPLVDKIVPLTSFNMRVGGICNGGNTPFAGSFILALTDAEGRIVDFVCGSQTYSETSPRSWRGYSSISCYLPVYPREGERIRLLYCSDEEAGMDPIPWKPVRWDQTLDIDGEVFVSDERTLEEVTSFSFSKTSGVLTVKTKDRVSWTLGSAAADEAGRLYGTELSIDTNLLPQDSYTLKIQRDNDKWEIKLKMGRK